MIVPYFVLCFVNLVLIVVLKSADNLSGSVIVKNIIGILYSRGTLEWMPNCTPLWFLTCMFVACVLFGLLLRIKSQYMITITVLVCVAISYLLDLFNAYKLPWNIDRL